jgi:hypothetical protein
MGIHEVAVTTVKEAEGKIHSCMSDYGRYKGTRGNDQESKHYACKEHNHEVGKRFFERFEEVFAQFATTVH